MQFKKSKQYDAINPKVIAEVAQELGISEEKVSASISHFFKWQRNAFNNLDYTSYLWNYFGTFTVMDKKYKKWIESEHNRLYIEQHRAGIKPTYDPNARNKTKSNTITNNTNLNNLENE